jgi:uncharacterized BrkB/YihY/UPF0761 family membrane protein
MTDDPISSNERGRRPKPASRAVRSCRERVAAVVRWLDTHRADNPLIDVGLRLHERDRAAAGGVTGSAVAFRLFLFFVPFLLFVVGVLGFVASILSGRSAVNTTGVTGRLAEQIEFAFSQPNSTRWLAMLAGLLGIFSSGRLLARVLVVASSLAWQMPLQRRSGVRIVGIVVGTAVAVATLAVLTNRVRQSAGVATATLSFVPVAVIYAVAWGLLSLVLPRATTDPTAVLPGAAVFGITLATMEAVTQLYLPGRFAHASALYGSVGVTVVTLGWFFILGRAVVLSMTINAVVYERFGSIATFVFGLPLLRALPQRSPSLARLIRYRPPEPDRPHQAEPEG